MTADPAANSHTLNQCLTIACLTYMKMKHPLPHHDRHQSNAPGSGESDKDCTKITHCCCDSNKADSFSTQREPIPVTFWAIRAALILGEEKPQVFLKNKNG